MIRLFLIFVKIGAILIGGGYVILPIMLNEFSEKRSLVSEEQIVEYYALSQSLPGIVAANISIFVGYKLRGVLGAILALIGVTFVPFWLIVFFASVLGKLVNNDYIAGALWGVGVAVSALIILSVREMWQKSERNYFFYIIFILSFLALIYTNLSPIQVIILFSILGLFIKNFERAR